MLPGKAHAICCIATPDLTVDFLVNGNKGRYFEGEDIMARHTLETGVTEIHQFGRGNGHINSGDIRLGLDYKFKNEDKLSAAYSLGGNRVKKNRTANTSFSTPENLFRKKSVSVGLPEKIRLLCTISACSMTVIAVLQPEWILPTTIRLLSRISWRIVVRKH